MVAAVGIQSPWLFTVPYLTIDEFKRAPTAIDVTNLHRGGTQAQQDAELANVIARASSWANTLCGQNLAATLDTEAGRVRVNRQGEIFVHPRYWPILAVTDFQLGSLPSTLFGVDLSTCWIESQSFTIAQPSLGLTSSQGPLQFASLRPDYRAFARWTYVNGWPTTTLAQTALSGAVSLVVGDATGIYPGTRLTVFDAQFTETVTVSAIVGNTLTVAATQFAHATVGVSVSALPPAVKEAVILLTCAFVEARGSEAIVMAQVNQQPNVTQSQFGSAVDHAAIAEELLAPFARVR